MALLRLSRKLRWVDSQNFHEGMYDFYDERGNLITQIDMHNQIKWDLVEE
jgi:hypothetical protein